jgi:hypothetical protein
MAEWVLYCKTPKATSRTVIPMRASAGKVAVTNVGLGRFSKDGCDPPSWGPSWGPVEMAALHCSTTTSASVSETLLPGLRGNAPAAQFHPAAHCGAVEPSCLVWCPLSCCDAEIMYADITQDGMARHPSFKRLVTGALRECLGSALIDSVRHLGPHAHRSVFRPFSHLL